MIQWFKKYFIPNPDNNNDPHFLRTEVTIFILVFILMAEVVYLVSVMGFFSRSEYFAEILSPVLVDSVNADRQKLNEGVLTVNPILVQAAQLKANDMASKGYFAHTSPEGVSPWYWFGQAGYKYVRAGENLAVNFNDSGLLHQAWMNSPTHRANIVNGYYSEIGIATATGVYNDREAVFVVELFGQPIKATASKIATTKSTPLPTKIPTSTPTPSVIISAVSPSTVILGTSRPVPTNTTVVATQQARAASTSLALTKADNVLSKANNDEVQNSSFVERIISQPKKIADDLTGLAILVSLMSLCLVLFFRVEFQNSRAIVNALIILIVLGGVLIANQHFFLANASIF